MYKMITTGLLCIAAVALKAQDAPIDSVDHTKSNTLGASSTVYTNDLIKYQSATILTGLQGRLKGLNVSPFRGMQLLRTDANTKSDIVGAIPNVGGGIYGDNSEFLISARGQSPVAIVDGVERDLYSIDPEAIESVTIQKDALSNMFLGMRSSRGALIITTKNPDAKGGFHLSLTGKFGISSALKSGPNPLSAYQYAYLLNEALLNDGKSPLYTYDDFEAYRNGTSPYLHPDVNWKDAIMNNSTTSQAYNLNVTGGGRVAQYFVSLGYYSENGLFKTSDANSYNTNFKYNRYLITSKVNINVTDEFKVSMSLMGRIEKGNQPGGISGTGYSDLLSNVWQTPNNAYPVLNPNGTYGGNASYTQNLYAQTTGSGYISSNTRDVVGTINLKYDFDKLVRGLSVGATGNISSQVRNAIVRTKQAQVFQYSITQQGNEAYDKYGDVSSQTNSYRSVSTYQYMYGKMYVDFDATLRGPIDALMMRGNMNILGKTDFTYVMKDSPLTVNDRLGDMVTFVNFNDTTEVANETIQPVSINGMDIAMTMHIDQAVQAHVDITPDGSNYMLLEGGGDLSFQYTPQGEMLLNGRYSLISGEMKYEIPVIPLKTFNIQNGSYVEWTGNGMNPQLNITATERVRATVGEDGQSPRMVSFDVGIALSQRLENLGLAFTLSAPEDASVQDQLTAMTPEERGKLAVTMLVTGMYMAEGNSTGGFNMSNALNSFLQSEISNIAGKALDISLGMETVDNAEDGGKRTDYNFQFAKRFWNNRFRIVIGGKVSTGNTAQQDETFIDNVSIEYRLDNSGTRYVKVFHDKNYESVLEGEIIETGVGIVLRKKMSHLGELFIFRKKKD